ncbi:PAS domain-containing sensor histidine kinase [Sphingomonas sp.]|uniref:PAS domain-containing sensor histidine kinase n=1 Tax=Sphingomonas sp. TaxID=28214 RepID=UPI003B3A5857
MPAYAWKTDAAGAFTYLDPRFLQWRGQTLDDHGVNQDGSLGYVDAVHPDDRADCIGRWLECLRSGTPFLTELRLCDAAGDYRWWRAEGLPCHADDGRIIEWSGSVIDVHDLKLAEARLRERERELMHLTDAVPVLIWSASASGEPTFINRRLSEWAGIRIDDLEQTDRSRLAAAVAQTVHPDDAANVSAALAAAFASGAPFAMRYRHRCADGSYRWVQGNAEPLRGEDGAILRWYGVSRDIEDEVRDREALRKTRERLDSATQLASLSTLAASIAHEVNQPLAAIVTNAQAAQRWLAADPPNLDRARGIIGRIVDAGQGAADVVQRIRALFNPRDRQREWVDVNALIADAASLMADKAVISGTRLTFNLAKALPTILADPVQVQQVVVNLIRNAIEAMEGMSAAALEVESRESGGAILISIRDAGPGHGDIAGMFEPFVTTKAGGMGMGLAICRSIAEAHGGSLRAEAAKPGLRMILSLPQSVPVNVEARQTRCA